MHGVGWPSADRGVRGRHRPGATNHALLKNYSIVGVHWGASLMRDPDSVKRQMAAVFELAAEGMVAPPVESVRPFEEAAAVIQAIADRQVTGKAVVTI